MTTIGTFTREGDTYKGTINALTLKAEASIHPVGKKSREKHPDFTVCTHDLDIGAGWAKTSKNGNEYLSIQIDDPSFPSRINARLVKTGILTYTLVWNRPRFRRDGE